MKGLATSFWSFALALGLIIVVCSCSRGKEQAVNSSEEEVGPSDSEVVEKGWLEEVLETAEAPDDLDLGWSEVLERGNDADGDATREDNKPDDNGPTFGDHHDAENMDDGFVTWLSTVTCSTPPPPGAELADPIPQYSGGLCPELVAGMNTLVTNGTERRFLLAIPKEIPDGESLPVLFLYYWLKGSASSFYKKGEIEAAVNQQRFIAVIPEAKGDLDLFGLVDLPWPILVFTPDSRFEEEFRFFDDMLACVGAQFPINKECVSVIGVSAGALFGVQLAGARSRHISSLISLSGGTQSDGASNMFIKPYKVPEHKWPALVLWGGPLDSCALLNFQAASQALEDHLVQAGQFFVECVHNCRHGEPPVEAPEGMSKYAAIWEFAFTHPYWLPLGVSPLQVTGIPPSWPSWCGIGKGSAVPRVGPCPEPGCPL